MQSHIDHNHAENLLASRPSPYFYFYTQIKLENTFISFPILTVLAKQPYTLQSILFYV